MKISESSYVNLYHQRENNIWTKSTYFISPKYAYLIIFSKFSNDKLIFERSICDKTLIFTEEPIPINEFLNFLKLCWEHGDKITSQQYLKDTNQWNTAEVSPIP